MGVNYLCLKTPRVLQGLVPDPVCRVWRMPLVNSVHSSPFGCDAGPSCIIIITPNIIESFMKDCITRIHTHLWPNIYSTSTL